MDQYDEEREAKIIAMSLSSVQIVHMCVSDNSDQLLG
jgi:hypothetical protein